MTEEPDDGGTDIWGRPLEPSHEAERDYEPIHPGTNWRKQISRFTGPIVAGLIALAKFSFVLVKFSSIFIAVAAYALIWGWRFAIGVVLLILLHETGHYIEAKREGLHPKLPVFIPFLGAYVAYTRGHPWQTVRVAIAGPILGGAAAFVFYLVRPVARLGPALRARLLRLLPQSLQPDPVRDLRRRRRVAIGALAPPRRRPHPRVRVVRAVLRDRGDADPRHGRVTRSAAPPVTDDRQILDHPATFDIDASVKKIADEFRAGFEKVALIDRPAAALFGSARVKEGSPSYEAARAVAKLFAERGLGRRHGRR